MGNRSDAVVRVLWLGWVGVLALAGCVVVEVPTADPAPPTLSEAPDLPAHADDPTAVEREIEDRIFALVNEARAAQGIAQLERHDGLDDVARRWSQYLAAEGRELAHNPQMAEQIPVGWTTAGENVAWIDDGGRFAPAQIASQVHDGWMESEGHRENVMQLDYTHLGVGVAHDAEHGYYLTQNFASY